jgi:MFS family permease
MNIGKDNTKEITRNKSNDSLESANTDLTDLDIANDSDLIEIQLFQQPDDNKSAHKLRRSFSLVRQLTVDNRSILDEEKVKHEDPNYVLSKQLTITDAARSMQSRAEDEANQERLDEKLPVVERAFTKKSDGTPDEPPDGGYGWVCCFSAGLILFATWGSNSAFGVYLAYYIDHNVFPGATKMDFAWIAGLIVCMGQIFSPVAFILVSLIGLKTTMFIAIALHFLGYLLASFATELWQLYLCQGLLVGSAYSLICVPAISIIPEWFLKRRGLASGLMCTGTGLGGLFYSLTVNALIQSTGDQRWSLRFVGITTAVLLTLGACLIRKRKESTDIKLRFALKAMFNPKVYSTVRLWSVSLWFAFSLLGYSITLFSYASVATALGLTQKQASVLTAVMNAAQTVGRPCIGVVADRWVGRINYTVILNFVVMVLIWAFWKSCRSFTSFLICGTLLGLFLGVGNVMNPVLTADAFEVDEFGCAWATLNVMMGIFSLFSEVIALSLHDNKTKNPYERAQWFAGLMFLVGVVVILPLREFQVHKVLKKRRADTEAELESTHLRVILDNDPEKVPKDEKKESKESDLKELLANYEAMSELTAKGYLYRTIYPIKV